MYSGSRDWGLVSEHQEVGQPRIVVTRIVTSSFEIMYNTG